jgi:hypothetical protein
MEFKSLKQITGQDTKTCINKFLEEANRINLNYQVITGKLIEALLPEISYKVIRFNQKDINEIVEAALAAELAIQKYNNC